MSQGFYGQLKRILGWSGGWGVRGEGIQTMAYSGCRIAEIGGLFHWSRLVGNYGFFEGWGAMFTESVKVIFSFLVGGVLEKI